MSDIVERLKSQDELYHQPNFGWEIDENKIEPLCMDAVNELLRLRAENEKLRAALEFYADNDNWRVNGPLDPNSGNFTGGPANEELGK